MEEGPAGHDPAPRYLPFGAYAPPSLLTPGAPPPIRAFELPSARGVVAAGLQLAVDATAGIRRASIYVGALVLGAFGPTAVLVLLLVARFLGIPGGFEQLTQHPRQFVGEHPEFIAPFAAAYIVGAIGVLLLVAILIDAQAIAISVLGGQAAGRPMTLREAITRARQSFWRLFAAAGLVGLGTGALNLLLTLPFLRPGDTNQGIGFIAQTVATLVFMPFAFAATGIVLGDAGALEALRRSIRLFRARPRVALVVTLFPLVTSAIQTFALDSGAGLVELVASFFHLGEGGGGSLLLAAVLALALVAAFGSLTFTIAAIVAAPQVSAFLGLTFYSAGLDGARASGGAARQPRLLTIPMALAMAIVGLVSLWAIVSFVGS